MPQLSFASGGDRTMVTWTYSTDLLKPHDPSLFYVMVHGPRSLAVEYGLIQVPLNVVHEEVSQLLVNTWEAYLFGEPDEVRQSAGRTHRSWADVAKSRPPF